MSTPELDLTALRAARTWADEHGHPQPDDRMLAAYGQHVAARAADLARAQTAEDIARAIDALDDHGYGMYAAAHREAAAIARSHGTAASTDRSGT